MPVTNEHIAELLVAIVALLDAIGKVVAMVMSLAGA